MTSLNKYKATCKEAESPKPLFCENPGIRSYVVYPLETDIDRGRTVEPYLLL